MILLKKKIDGLYDCKGCYFEDHFAGVCDKFECLDNEGNSFIYVRLRELKDG